VLSTCIIGLQPVASQLQRGCPDLANEALMDLLC
jgi:hypothetical protein